MMMMGMGEMWASLGSGMAGLMFIWAMYNNYFPHELQGPLKKFGQKLKTLIYPYIQITFSEYQGDGFVRSKAYTAIERYLEKNSSKEAKRLIANVVHDCKSIVLSMQDHEEVTDSYQGIELWWASSQHVSMKQSISFYPREDKKRYFNLTFHKKYRDIITKNYLNHVLEEGKAITVKERQRKLFTNCKGESWSRYTRSMWSHVVFEHPATFDTIVKDNTELRKLLIDTSGKSIIVIEDIDCSLDLTGQREKKKGKKGEEISKKDEKGSEVEEKMKEKMGENNKDSKVTLSGLLNFIDGLWSAIGGERITVFTTNYVEKLDPALIRRGRMDKHIELSYCGFEAFQVLAKNYLDVESHKLFTLIKKLLEETNMSPADVAENLMPKSSGDDKDVCLERLVKAIKVAKQEEEEEAERVKKAEIEKERAEKEKEAEQNSDKLEVKENGKIEESEGKEIKENGHIIEG